MLATPCRPARGLFTFIQLSFSASRPKVARAPGAAMFRFPGAVPNAFGWALGCYITTYVMNIKCLNPDLKDFKDGRNGVLIFEL